MTRCGGVIYEPGHNPACAGTPEPIGVWTYEGYGVVRVFEVRFCRVCGYADDHHKIAEHVRQVPITREEVIRLQRTARANREALIATARERARETAL